MALITRRNLGLAAGMLTAVVLTAGALISFTVANATRPAPVDDPILAAPDQAGDGTGLNLETITP